MQSSGKMRSWCAALPRDLDHTEFWEPRTHVRVYTDYPHPNLPGILCQLSNSQLRGLFTLICFALSPLHLLHKPDGESGSAGICPLSLFHYHSVTQGSLDSTCSNMPTVGSFCFYPPSLPSFSLTSHQFPLLWVPVAL